MEDAFYKTLEATGTVQDDFSYDSFAQELKLAALGYLGYTLRAERPHRLLFLSPATPSTPISAAKVLMPKDTS